MGQDTSVPAGARLYRRTSKKAGPAIPTRRKLALKTMSLTTRVVAT